MAETVRFVCPSPEPGQSSESEESAVDKDKPLTSDGLPLQPAIQRHCERHHCRSYSDPGVSSTGPSSTQHHHPVHSCTCVSDVCVNERRAVRSNALQETPEQSQSPNAAELRDEFPGLDGTWESVDGNIPVDFNCQVEPLNDVEHDAARPVLPFNYSVPALIIGAALGSNVHGSEADLIPAPLRHNSRRDNLNHTSSEPKVVQSIESASEGIYSSVLDKHLSTGPDNQVTQPALTITTTTTNIVGGPSIARTHEENRFEHPRTAPIPPSQNLQPDNDRSIRVTNTVHWNTSRRSAPQHITVPIPPPRSAQRIAPQFRFPAPNHTASRNQLSFTGRLFERKPFAFLKKMAPNRPTVPTEYDEFYNKPSKRARRITNRTDHIGDGQSYQSHHSASQPSARPQQQLLVSRFDTDSDDDDERLYKDAPKTPSASRHQSGQRWSKLSFSSIRAKSASPAQDTDDDDWKLSQEDVRAAKQPSGAFDLEAQRPFDYGSYYASPTHIHGQQNLEDGREASSGLEFMENPIVYGVKLFFKEFLPKLGKTLAGGEVGFRGMLGGDSRGGFYR